MLTLNLIVGLSGYMLVGGTCNIIIGDKIEPPSPVISYYINIDGTVYPNSARWDPKFQAMVRRRAVEVAEDDGIRLDPSFFDKYYFDPNLCDPDIS